MTGDGRDFAGMPDDADALHRWIQAEGRLDLLRSRLTLSDIVGRTVPLEPAEHGEMRGPCPHPEHDDAQKAFFVNDRKGFFHCFGCGIHGDAIRWAMDYDPGGREDDEGWEERYVEAVRALAARAGLRAET